IMLLSGHIDAIVYPEPVLMRTATDLRLQNTIKTVGKPMLEVKRGIAVRKDNLELQGLLEKAVEKCIGSDKHKVIYQKWYGNPIPFWTARRVGFTSLSLLVVSILLMGIWKHKSVLRINRKLLNSEKDLSNFKQTLDNTFDCVFMFEPDTLKFTYINKGALEQVGYSYDELLNMTPLDIKPAFTGDLFREMVAPLLDGTKPYHTFETVHRHKNGNDIPVEIVLQFISSTYERGKFVAIVRDITARKIAEEKIRESDLRYRTVFENSKDGISIYERAETSERRLIDCNPSYVRMSGRTREELLAAEDIRTMQATENPEFDTAAIQQKIVNEQPYWGTFSWRRPDGKENYIEYEAVPLKIAGNTYIYVIDRDITARKKADDELRELAHDLGERVKEQKCLYNISKLDERPEVGLDEIIQGVADNIPPGWHYPDITCAMITINGKEYKTANFKETDWKQSSDIYSQGARIGSLT
ncbi:hypothetical protein LCGC14_2584180, partial [marine sediment metagenome]